MRAQMTEEMWLPVTLTEAERLAMGEELVGKLAAIDDVDEQLKEAKERAKAEKGKLDDLPETTPLRPLRSPQEVPMPKPGPRPLSPDDLAARKAAREQAGAELRALREQVGISQRGLARALGYSETAAGEWESGRASAPPEAVSYLRDRIAESSTAEDRTK